MSIVEFQKTLRIFANKYSSVDHLIDALDLPREIMQLSPNLSQTQVEAIAELITFEIMKRQEKSEIKYHYSSTRDDSPFFRRLVSAASEHGLRSITEFGPKNQAQTRFTGGHFGFVLNDIGWVCTTRSGNVEFKRVT